MEKIPDYIKLWNEIAEKRNAAKQNDQDGDIWEKRAQKFDRQLKKRWKKSDSSREWMLDLLRRNPGSTLLDIGAGTGAWACLLAPLCRTVTAIDPSQAMIDILKNNMIEANVDNIEIIQDTWPFEMNRSFDFTLSSHSIYGCSDFEEYIRAMQTVTRKTCVLLLRAPSPVGLMADISRTILGTPYDSPNFQIAYNALLQMGIFADVVVENDGLWKPWRYYTLSEAVNDIKEKMGVMDLCRYDDYLMDLLETHLQKTEQGLMWPEIVRTVLVHWNVDKSEDQV
ncbi:MAG: class I SAM-dependent methyltransferase [bacterium]